ILRHTQRGASPIIEKVVNSAIANAEHNYEMDADNLVISEAYVDEGITLKRFRPRARGRAGRINKRTSHITIVVSEKKEGYLVGQKINPTGLRVGIIRDWESRWYAEKDYADLLHEDIKIREYLENRLQNAAVSSIEIERAANRINITIHTGKPGMVIGKGGSEVEALRKSLNHLTGKRVHINIVEIKKVDLDAKLVADNIARQLENRISFRRAQKQAIQRAMRGGAK